MHKKARNNMKLEINKRKKKIKRTQQYKELFSFPF